MNAELLESELAKQVGSVQEAQDIVTAVERAEVLTRGLLMSSRRALPQETGLDNPTTAVVRGSKPAIPGVVAAHQRGPITGNGTILLVEDEKALRALQKRILTGAGYKVLEASDGVEALRMAVGEVGEIDLVVTDVEMPTLGGRGMVNELSELSPGIRVLFMSGYTDNEILRRGIGTAETQFLQKPFTAATLKNAVKTALAKPATALT
jgi:CheY-like chemotaxis protein